MEGSHHVPSCATATHQPVGTEASFCGGFGFAGVVVVVLLGSLDQHFRVATLATRST